MRSGVQSFVGARLAEARQARGITSRKALADLMQRAASTVIRWEEGETAPEPAALTELASVLRLPEDFFLTARREGSGLSFFRSFAGALRGDRLAQQVRLAWLEDVTAVAEHYAHLPEINVPDLLQGRNFRNLRDEDIEAYAQAAREHWGLGLRPILNMVELLQRIGVVVASEPMETDQLDGLSRWGADGRPYVLLASDKQSFSRRQFDAAHELAHLVLHRAVTEEEFVENFKAIEDQAHRFASAFLLPASQFSVEIDTAAIWELERLKARWKVSIKAQIMRLQRLQILDKSSATRLYKIYSAKGYSRREPFDDVWPMQEPTLLADVFKALVDAGQVTKEDLREDLPLFPHDVESLTGLPSGWLSLQAARIVELKPVVTPRDNLGGVRGEVVPIKRNGD
ncbi:XRE family transcriptional regulator [Rhizobium leguminosarum]|uniref:XRE family transcriptional regulator n=1 Tax=Rhizobium leguminosarum TaxID=384 RepID=UPI00103F372A|nr:XRE family transcriptional regulator [Rhizobium leguminosarum]NKK29694.1 ImmA/IrrE family metallo-endopeptidase [Rhizobium leguminosarum bv. viciae]TBZ54135.1 ImmA/IrrE family metallo-endopeptidase [Rhizobium leguminosarum bv. viciae]